MHSFSHITRPEVINEDGRIILQLVVKDLGMDWIELAQVSVR